MGRCAKLSSVHTASSMMCPRIGAKWISCTFGMAHAANLFSENETPALQREEYRSATAHSDSWHIKPGFSRYTMGNPWPPSETSLDIIWRPLNNPSSGFTRFNQKRKGNHEASSSPAPAACSSLPCSNSKLTQMWFDADNNLAPGTNPKRFYRVVPIP